MEIKSKFYLFLYKDVAKIIQSLSKLNNDFISEYKSNLSEYICDEIVSTTYNIMCSNESKLTKLKSMKYFKKIIKSNYRLIFFNKPLSIIKYTKSILTMIIPSKFICYYYECKYR